jgi:hypothetical protein
MPHGFAIVGILVLVDLQPHFGGTLGGKRIPKLGTLEMSVRHRRSETLVGQSCSKVSQKRRSIPSHAFGSF